MYKITAKNDCTFHLEGIDIRAKKGFQFITTHAVATIFLQSGQCEVDSFYNTKEIKEKIDFTGKKLLVARTGGLGDFFFILRTLIDIRKKYKDVSITFCCSPKYMSFLRTYFYPHVLTSIEPIIIKHNLFDNCDHFITFEGYIETERAGRKYNAFYLASQKFHKNISSDHHIELRLPPIYQEQAKELSKQWGRPVIGMQLKASAQLRTYPYKYQKEVIKLMDKLGYDTLLLDNKENIEEVINLWDEETMKYVKFPFNSTIKPSLDLTIALVPHCSLIIAPDSLFVYVGDSFNVPTIGLYSVVSSQLRAAGLNVYALETTGNNCANCGTMVISPVNGVQMVGVHV